MRVLAAETTSFLEPLAREHGVVLHVEGTEARTTGDAARLAEAVTSLVVNAIEHGGPDGRVVVTTGVEDDAVFLSVTDTGAGIPEADLPHVFERFYRVDDSRSARTGGRGLGLAIAKQIVEAQGGAIRAESPRGGGTVFTVRLPAGEPA